jgi:hypothetical protein
MLENKRTIPMARKSSEHLFARFSRYALLAAILLTGSTVFAESCLTAGEMDEASRTAVTTSAQRFFDLAAKGDTATLRQNAMASVASDFAGIEASVKDNQPVLAGATVGLRPPFLLKAEGMAKISRAEFYCGVFNNNGQTPGSAVFVLNDLPTGNYVIAIFDATSPKGGRTVSLVLQQQGSDWKLGGLYVKVAQSAGHDSDWFALRARDFKAKGQAHNAWFYFLEAQDLALPLAFMSTQTTDKLYDESQKLRPPDLPAEGKPSDIGSGAQTYRLTSLFPQAVGDELDLVVKYQSADVSNTAQAYQNNLAVAHVLLVKYPELREAFAAIVARAVDPTGRDYGSLVTMKEIK